MSIENQLTTRLKEAMRAQNKREVDVVRMVKTQASIARTAPGFSGETDDAFWVGVIDRYVKQQKRAQIEFEKGGEKGALQIEQLQFEIDYLSQFLPKLKNEEETRKLVKEAISETGAVDKKMTGRVMGAVMKRWKNEVDAEVVKKILEEELR